MFAPMQNLRPGIAQGYVSQRALDVVRFFREG